MIRFTSIRQKMMLVVMSTTLFALLLSASALFIYESRSFRAGWIEDMRTQADLVAHSSLSALEFDDARVARQNLALLRLRPQVEAAGIYGADGRLFASYAADGQATVPGRVPPVQEGARFDGQRFELRQTIEHEGNRRGTLYLRAHYDVAPRLIGYLGILLAATLTSLALASLISSRLQRAITDPIVAVADVARDVVQQRNYALRAPKQTSDEVGALVDAFNDMLCELGEHAEALRAADRRKDEFLATLAHELRNPLAPLSTALTILARADIDAATRERLRVMMQRQLAQLVRLIDDLLEVARISTGRIVLQREVLDLTDVVRSAVESVGSLIAERKHVVHAQWPTAPVCVDGDRTRLVQVFVNLLNNAAKYTDPGGRIDIAFRSEGAHCEVSVADSGIGIDPSMHDAVFEMFVQVDRSLERDRAGLGVGLSLARQLVELHGGSLVLSSAGVGRGATFTVRLATTDPASRNKPPAPQARTVNATQLSILLADDNRDFAESLSTLLSSLGHDVTVVYDGDAALQAARRQLPQVGLFDIGMPGLNGYDVASAIRRERDGRNVLLIAITGWGQEGDRQRALGSGFDHHLVKPVDPARLIELLERHAAAGGPGVAAST